MLVPLELSVLSQRKGYVSPEMSIGWRVGTYVREFFGSLKDVLMAARINDDAAFALQWLTRRSLWSDVTVTGQERPWDFLVYHVGTGTLLQMIQSRTCF